MEMTNLPAGAPKKIKMSLADLPAGTKEGDSITVKIDSINQATGVAYVSNAGTEDADQTSAAAAVDEVPEEGGSDDETSEKDTSVLLGPMDGLKNYLVQKSMDVPKNQSR